VSASWWPGQGGPMAVAIVGCALVALLSVLTLAGSRGTT
jgi:hypothetical protein